MSRGPNPKINAPAYAGVRLPVPTAGREGWSSERCPYGIVYKYYMRLLKSNSILSLANSYLVDSPQPSSLSYM